MARTNLELITEPPAEQTIAAPPPSRNRVGPLLISIVAPLLAIAWGFLASSSHDRGLAKLDDAQLSRAEAAWTSATEDALTALGDEARVLVDDARIREPMAVPDVDDETLNDLLNELKAASRASLVGIVGPTGSVRVVAGADSMKGVDLRGSALMKPAEGNTPSTTWIFPDRIVAVVVAPIRLGERFVGHLMLGRDIGPSTLSLVERATGATGAVVFQQKLVVSTNVDDARRSAVLEAASLEPGNSASVAGNYLARTMRVDANKGGRVVFMVPRGHAATMFGMGGVLWWSPAILVVIAALLFWGIEYRRPALVGGAI